MAILLIFPGFGVEPESSNWTFIRNSKLNIMFTVCFLQKKELRMRSTQRIKRKHKKEMETSLKKWHAMFREKCIQRGSKDSSYDKKWEHYQSAQRLNVD